MSHEKVIEQLNQARVPVEAGERYLIEFLVNHLNDKYQIFFQPYLNGDRPDIIVVLQNYGVLIIEVKDWDLRCYEIDKRKHWNLKTNGKKIKSPIEQVIKYKENMYELHLPELLEQNIHNRKSWGMVTCAVYFHCASESDVKKKMVVALTRMVKRAR